MAGPATHVLDRLRGMMELWGGDQHAATARLLDGAAALINRFPEQAVTLAFMAVEGALCSDRTDGALRAARLAPWLQPLGAGDADLVPQDVHRRPRRGDRGEGTPRPAWSALPFCSGLQPPSRWFRLRLSLRLVSRGPAAP
jgi:hypothetical protein